MAQYRFLQDSFIDSRYYQANDIASTADVGGTLPAGWVPSAAVDPQDTDAVTAYYNAGVQQLGLVRAQWAGPGVNAPATFWLATVILTPMGRYATQYQLTGLGSALPPIFM